MPAASSAPPDPKAPPGRKAASWGRTELWLERLLCQRPRDGRGSRRGDLKGLFAGDTDSPPVAGPGRTAGLGAAALPASTHQRPPLWARPQGRVSGAGPAGRGLFLRAAGAVRLLGSPRAGLGSALLCHRPPWSLRSLVPLEALGSFPVTPSYLLQVSLTKVGTVRAGSAPFVGVPGAW